MGQVGAGETLPLSRFARQKVVRNDKERVLFNIKVNSARNVPWMFGQMPPRDGEILFVANAPSVKGSIPQIRRKQKKGAKVWAINGAHDYLISKGITPDAAGFCDPADRMPDVVTKLNDDTAYLVASCCSPRFFDHLTGRKVILWHMNNEFGEEALVRSLGLKYDKKGEVFSGGSTCMLRLPSLAYYRGYRNFHFYGVDSSFEGPSHINRDDTELFGKIFHVECNGRVFRTNIPLARQVEEFALLTEILGRNGCTINVHGHGLLPYRFRQARIK